MSGAWKEVRPEHITVHDSSWPTDGRFRFGVKGDVAYGSREGYETEAAYVNAVRDGFPDEVPPATTWYTDVVVALTNRECLALLRQLADHLDHDVRDGLPADPPDEFSPLVEPYTWSNDD